MTCFAQRRVGEVKRDGPGGLDKNRNEIDGPTVKFYDLQCYCPAVLGGWEVGRVPDSEALLSVYPMGSEKKTQRNRSALQAQPPSDSETLLLGVFLALKNNQKCLSSSSIFIVSSSFWIDVYL